MSVSALLHIFSRFFSELRKRNDLPVFQCYQIQKMWKGKLMLKFFTPYFCHFYLLATI